MLQLMIRLAYGLAGMLWNAFLKNTHLKVWIVNLEREKHLCERETLMGFLLHVLEAGTEPAG